MYESPANRKLVITLTCLFLLYFTWGSVYLSIRFALESFPPVLLSGMRYLCAGSALLLWSFGVKKDSAIPSAGDFKAMALSSFFMIAVSGSLLNIAEVYISSGVTALILGSIPLWMVVSSWLFGGEPRPSLSVASGLLGGFFGVIMLGISTGLQQSGSLLGLFCALGSVFGWVAGSLYAKGHRLTISMVKSLGFQMVMGGAFMIVAAGFTGEYGSFSFSEVSLKSWMSLAHLVLFGSLVGYTCYMWLLYNTPTPVAVSYAYVEPVLAVALGAAFASEKVTGFTAAACAFIIFSVFFVMKGRNNG